MSEEAKLLPCPFCGGEYGLVLSAPTAQKGDEYVEGTRFYPIVFCSKCGASSIGLDFDNSGDTAKNSWNTRSLEAAKALLKQHGLVAVPVEPTKEIVKSGAHAIQDTLDWYSEMASYDSYTAMIAAAQGDT